jgi:hypothetical protein
MCCPHDGGHTLATDGAYCMAKIGDGSAQPASDLMQLTNWLLEVFV